MNTMIKNISILSVVLTLAACTPSPEGEKARTEAPVEEQSASGNFVTYAADIASSRVDWEGAKPAKKHHGELYLKSGSLFMENGKIAGGKLVLDMNSMKNLDLTDAEWNAKLIGHLKSEDFFHTAKYPEATFSITGVEQVTGKENASPPVTHTITGNLMVKGISKSITFPANIIVRGGTVSATTPPFTIDRTEWDVRYQSGKFINDVKDNLIADEISLAVTLVAKEPTVN